MARLQSVAVQHIAIRAASAGQPTACLAGLGYQQNLDAPGLACTVITITVTVTVTHCQGLCEHHPWGPCYGGQDISAHLFERRICLPDIN